jgi:hypothetical protein
MHCRDEPHLVGAVPSPPNCGVDDAAGGSRGAIDKGEIPLFYGAIVELRLHRCECAVVTCRDDQATRLTVEAMDDTWAQCTTNAHVGVSVQ